MKTTLTTLIICFSCSCSIHRTAYTSEGEASRKIVHETTRPDTCRKSRLTYVYWHWRKGHEQKQDTLTFKR